MSSISFVKRRFVIVPPARSHRQVNALTATCSGLIAASVLAAAIASSYIPLCSLYLRNNRASLLIPKVTNAPNFEAEEYLQLAQLVLSKHLQERLEGAQVMNGAPATNAARLPIPKPRPSKLIAQTQSEQDGFLHSVSKMLGARTVYASLKDRPQ